MLNFKRRSTTSILIPISNPAVDHSFFTHVLEQKVIKWLNENVGAEASDLATLIKPNSNTDWYVSDHPVVSVDADNKRNASYVIYFVGKSKAAHFKLVWL